MQQAFSRESTIEADTETMNQGHAPNRDAAFKSLLRVRDFRLLWLGEGNSVLGDHFHMVALPWLVLQLSDDSLAMGTVLALAAVPRAVFMLVGGALTDRFSPRTVMLASNLVRLVLVSTLAGVIQLWMLYL